VREITKTSSGEATRVSGPLACRLVAVARVNFSPYIQLHHKVIQVIQVMCEEYGFVLGPTLGILVLNPGAITPLLSFQTLRSDYF
jgi:hypothetical protein